MRRLAALLLVVPLVAAACGGGKKQAVKHSKLTAKASRPVSVFHPTAGSSVRSPLRVTGTADLQSSVTFELRTGSKVLAKRTITSRQPSQQAAFRTTLGFHVPKKSSGLLVVSSKGRKSGSKVTVSNLPLQLLP